MISFKKFYRDSIAFLVEYAKNNKLQSYIIGISGGIDSTVVAAIASEACKKAQIPLVGRCMITPSNLKEEREAADLVGKAFCTDYKLLSINHRVNIIKEFIEVIEGKMTNLQFGNIKARFRMMYLYHLASMYKGCVLDTDNKTEHELGFWTLHGDVGDVNCGLIHLWKTEVYELANFILEKYSNTSTEYDALLKSMKLTPTDGNGVSKNDCEQFGLDNYEQVDDVLKTMYFETPRDPKDNHSYDRLIDEYNEQGVDKVMMLHQNSAFKRKSLPICPDKWKVIYKLPDE